MEAFLAPDTWYSQLCCCGRCGDKLSSQEKRYLAVATHASALPLSGAQLNSDELSALQRCYLAAELPGPAPSSTNDQKWRRLGFQRADVMTDFRTGQFPVAVFAAAARDAAEVASLFNVKKPGGLSPRASPAPLALVLFNSVSLVQSVFGLYTLGNRVISPVGEEHARSATVAQKRNLATYLGAGSKDALPKKNSIQVGLLDLESAHTGSSVVDHGSVRSLLAELCWAVAKRAMREFDALPSGSTVMDFGKALIKTQDALLLQFALGVPMADDLVIFANPA